MENLLCKLCEAQVQAWEFEVYDPKIYSGLLRVKCTECGYESNIRIYGQKEYDSILSKVTVDPKVFRIFEFNGVV